MNKNIALQSTQREADSTDILQTAHRFHLGLTSVIGATAFAVSAAAATLPTVTTVATGLNNPRGLAIGPSGVLYVAEAGLGAGDGHGGSALGVGFTGAIREIRNLNTQPTSRLLVSNLASVGTPGHPSGVEVVGPDGLSYLRADGLYVIMAESVSGVLAEDPNLSPDVVGQFGHLLKLTFRGLYGGGANTPLWHVVADVGDFNYGWTGAHKDDRWAPHNPPPDNSSQFPDANPYAVLALKGHQFVVDAGANTLNEVRADGTVRIVAYIPDPVVGGHPVSDSVPTCIAQGKDGWLYLGTLAFGANAAGGGGQSMVYRVNPNSTNSTAPIEVWATGLNPITGCAFGPDGALYVTEFSTHFPTTDLGDVVRIEVKPDGTAGTHKALGTGSLHSPNGLAIDRDGSIYVSNYSTSTSKDAHPGEVVRVNK